MPLTRHLYELDEVVSALQTCLRKRWPRSSFWLWELIQSGEASLAVHTLRTSWILFGAPYDTGLLDLDPNTNDLWIQLLTRVEKAIEKNKASVFKLMDQTVMQPKRRYMTPTARTAKAVARRAAIRKALEYPTNQEFCITLDAAARQRYTNDAVWLIQAAQPVFCADELWAFLQIICRPSRRADMDRLQDIASSIEDLGLQVAVQAAAAALLCQSTAAYKEPLEKDSMTSYTKRQWALWDTKVGRREARIHHIPEEALHKETTRGRLSRRYTNIGDLRDPVPSLFEGCAWWTTQIQECEATQDDETGAVVFPDDDVLESFYAAHLPDDIPDEWSTADQTKSHGRGCMETAPAPLIPKIRDEAIERRYWAAGIHVPSRSDRVKKKLTGPQPVKKVA
jgi:hypothetical protein